MLIRGKLKLNTLKLDENELATLNFNDLFTKILQCLTKSNSTFDIPNDYNRLLINIDEVAYQVACGQVENPLGSSSHGARSATINFSHEYKDKFSEQVRQIREILKQQLVETLAKKKPQLSFEQYIDSLITELSKFKGNSQSLGLTYPFSPQKNLHKQRLTVDNNTNNPLLRFHKLTIDVEKTKAFEENLQASLKNHIDITFEDNEVKKEITDIFQEMIKSPKSDFYDLKKLVDTEALSKIQKEAKVKYLEFLHDNCSGNKDIIYLKDFIRRLKLIESYINDETKSDGDYEVNYAGESFNYKDIFSTADALNKLPIISLIEGCLGETTDDKTGNIQFIFGLKIKLNNEVSTLGYESVFEYNTDLLHPDSQAHKEGLENTFKKPYFVKKVLHIAFLYFVMFASRSNPKDEKYNIDAELDYDPIDAFEKKVLPIFQGSDDAKKEELFRKIIKGFKDFNAEDKLLKLRNLLKTCIEKKSKPRTYRIKVGVKKGILETNIKTILNADTLFKKVLKQNPKEALRYIVVGDESVDNSFFCTLPVSISISSIDYFSTADTQSFSMEYEIDKVTAIPVIVCPKEKQCIDIYKTSFGKENILVFPYEYQRLRAEIFKNTQLPRTFIYQLTFSLLAYTCLNLLTENRRLFIPIIRLHLNKKDDDSPEETFMRSLFFSIAHLLNENHRSNSQGFYVKDLKYKVSNGLSSLYSVLPRKFTLSNNYTHSKIDKLAIVVVSSRESDASTKDEYKIINLIGEVIGVHRKKDNSIRVQKRTSFSDNYSSQDIHSNPIVLLDEVNKLYKEGYQHILYIAKSPYSQKLNITRVEEDKQLFFMSKTIMRRFTENNKDIKIYPIFFDKYFAVKIQNPKPDSLYIQDTLELTSLFEDPNKQSVVFFNLFNGIAVNPNAYYTGVISYATLLNMYEGILDDKDLRMGLIYDSQLKNQLLEYLTFYHFFRYEGSSTKTKSITIKLDPYQDIIGDESVAKKSVFNHMTSGVKFNSLAFLTEVRKALNIPK